MKKNVSKKLIIVLGPTAIGKTSLSIKLAKYYNTEIISADSRQFYKELLIGSAAPSNKEICEVKHHFIHNLSITEDYNVGKFEKEAINKIEEIFKTQDKILMVGGSGLYIDAICKGIDDIPKVSLKDRESIIKDYKEKGINFLQEQVKLKDPIYYKKVDKNNPQRLIRALEVMKSTLKPFSSFHKKENKKRNFKIIKIGLEMERADLYMKINERVDIMIKKGLLNEVKELMPHREKNALQTVGYQEIFKFLDGIYSFTETVEKIKQNTRRYAKRQITWFKKDNKTNFFPLNSFDEIIKFIEQ